MKKGFDNFNAVDSGFVSFVTPTIPSAQTSQNLNNLIAQLPQQYQDVLNNNLSSKLNNTQIQELFTILNNIANNSSFPLDMKITNAMETIYRRDPLRLEIGVPTSFELNLAPQLIVKELRMNGDIDESTMLKIATLSQEEQMQLFEKLKVILLDKQLSNEEIRSMAISILTNDTSPQNSQTKSTQGQNQNQSNDSIKNVFIVLAVGIVGFMGYTALKK